MAQRPEFTPRFEETEEQIKDRMLGRIPEEWRKEPGDFMYDAVAPTPLEIQQLQVNQDYILRNSFAQYAEGEYLDLLLLEAGLERRTPATPNKRTLLVTAEAGVTLHEGHIASAIILDDDGNPIEYTVDQRVDFFETGTLEVNITCNLPGEIGNLATGSEFILLPSIPGIRSIEDNGTYELGYAEESDAQAWERYLFKQSNEDTGGNKNDYVRWATDMELVGRAKCIPRWDGNGTVKVLITGTDYRPALPQLVETVQNELDPGSTGLGEGKAPLGAAVTVATPNAVTIAVEATVLLQNNASLEDVKQKFEDRLESYITSLVFNVQESTGQHFPVSYNQVGALLITMDEVMNYEGLKINGGTSDIQIGSEEIPTRGTVNLS